MNIKVFKPLPPTDNGAQSCAGTPHQYLLFPKCCSREPTCPWTQCVRLVGGCCHSCTLPPLSRLLAFSTSVPSIPLDALQLSAVLFKCKTCISGELSRTALSYGNHSLLSECFTVLLVIVSS